MVVIAAAEGGRDAPTVYACAKLFLTALDGGVAILHGRRDFELLGIRQLRRVERKAGADTDRGKLQADSYLFWDLRTKLQQEVQEPGELPFECVFGELWKFDGRRRGRRRSMRIGGQGLGSVSVLDLFDIGYVIGAEELSAEDQQAKLCVGLECAENAPWCSAMPSPTGDHVTASGVAGGARANVAVVEGVHVNELDRVVTVLGDLGDAENDGLSAQVRLQHGVGSIAVGCDNRGVFRREYVRVADHDIKGPLVLRTRLVNVELVTRLVISDHGEGVDVGLLVVVLVDKAFVILPAARDS